MIDEFQYLSAFVYPDQAFEKKPIESLPGSFHQVSESKVAPMLATGSYVGWMIDIMDNYLEAGRLSRIFISPYLTEAEGLQAVYKYAEVFEEPITNESAVQINQMSSQLIYEPSSERRWRSCRLRTNHLRAN